MPPSPAAIVTSTVRPAPLARLVARVEGVVTGPTRVVRARGRRAGAPENLIEEVVSAGIRTVIAETITAFHPSPARSLAVVVALRRAGVAVVTLNDGQVASGDPVTLAAVAAFLAGVEQKAASKRGRSAIAQARTNGRSLGRPKKPVDLVRARALIEEHGSIRRAALVLGLGATTLRRVMALKSAA